MSKPRKPRKPEPFGVGPYRCRAIRGPREPGVWYWRAERHGEDRHTLWTGWATREDAMQAAIDAAMGAPERPHRPKRATSGIDTVDFLIRAWLADQRQRPDLSPYTLAHYERGAVVVTEYAGDLSVLRITVGSLEEVKRRLLRVYAPSTTRQHLRVLRIAWSWARARGYLHTDLPPVRQPKVKTEKYTPSSADVGAMLRALDQSRSVAAGAVRMMYATGARRGEASGITWADVNESAGVMVLRGKTGPRPFPLSAQVKEILRPLPRKGLTIYGASHATVYKAVHKTLRLACDRAGVQRFTAHALRRAAVDAMAEAGIDVGTAGALLGHTPEVMLRHYRQARGASLARAAAVLGTVPDAKVLPFPVASGED